jgi:hypothetical protein
MKVSVRPSSGRVAGYAIVVSLSRCRLALPALVVWIGVAAPAAFGQGSPEIFREIPAAGLSTGYGASDLDGPSVVRSRYVEVDLDRILPRPEPAPAAPSRARGAATRRLTFNLFADAVEEFELERGEYSADGSSYAWFGRPAEGGGQAVLVVRDGRVAGSVRTASGDFYRIRSVNSRVHRIRQVTYQGTPAVEDAIPVPESEIPQAAFVQQDAPVAEQSGSTTLGVMVVYTPGARQAAGGTAGIQSEIQLAITELNQSFNNSGVQMQAQLVHSAEIAYNDEQNSLGTTLSRLRGSGDGYMDPVHTLRNQYGADVVALLVNGPGSSGGTVGVGYIMQTVGSYFADYAFSVTEVNFATGPSYALLHEIGHNLGAAHDRAHSSSPGAYPYSYGYQRSTTPRFRTIMSYNCSGVNCPTVPHWSNPNVNYQGNPTGIASSLSNSADNRQTLNNTKATAAAWRQGSGSAPAAPAAPSAVSVSPSSGSGASRTFRLTATDGNGYNDLISVQFTVGQSISSTNSCNLAFGPQGNLLYLLNDARTAWLGPVVLGSSATLANSQCSVNIPGSSASGSGNTLTVDLAMNFAPSYGGSKNLFLYALDKAGHNSGWQTKGAWTVPGAAANQPPTISSVSPSSGSGANRTFRLSVGDPNGYNDLISVQFVVDQNVGSANTCHLAYGPDINRLYLLNDNRTQWLGAVPLGTAGTLSNSQCSVNLGSSSASGSGTALTVDLNMTFSPSYEGSKNLHVYTLDRQSQTSGWQTKGTWTVPGGGTGGGTASATPQPPTIGAVTPSSGNGTSQMFRVNVSDPNGHGNLISVQMVIDQAIGTYNTCHLAYGPNTNLLYLLNDARTQWLGPLPLGSSGTLGNSQCSVNLGASSKSGSGTNLAVDLAMTFSGGFAGTKNLFVYALDQQYQHSGWQTKGSWVVPGGSSNQPPTLGSVTPSSGSGSNRTFRFTASDPNGYGDLISMQVVFDQSVGVPNTCHLAYGPPANQIFLLNDSRTQWLGGVQLGSGGTLSNGQCSVNLGASSAFGSGNTVTLDLNMTFSGGYSGAKNIWMYTLDKLYKGPGWQAKGTWTVP